MSAHSLLQSLPKGGLAAAGECLRRYFGVDTLISTVFDGDRAENLSPDVQADLKSLQSVLSPGQLSLSPMVRDSVASEPALLTMIRQCEGKPPLFPACLTPSDDIEAEDALNEAKAAGFSLNTGRRRIGLMAPRTARVLDKSSGFLEFEAGASWETLQKVAEAAQLSLAPLRGADGMRPIDACQRLAKFRGSVAHKFGLPWRAALSLPAHQVGLSTRTWAFRDHRVAEDTLREVAHRFAPDWAETIPGIEAQMLASAGAWKGHRWYKRNGNAGGLSVRFVGSALARRAALAETSWFVERRGGVCHWRDVNPNENLVNAIIAANGTGRISTETDGDLSISAPHKHHSIVNFDGLRVQESRITYYIRDLSRSLEEAQDMTNNSVTSNLLAFGDRTDADLQDALGGY